MTSLCLLVLAALSLLSAADDSWTNCPPACKCTWVSGRKSADCTNASLSAVPANLSSEIQLVDLSHNQLAVLPADAFLSVNLVNVHKLKLRWCGIYSVDKRAFSSLSILTQLDLSNNMITSLHPSTFRDITRLTDLNLDNNPLRKLEDGLFNNLLYLQIVEVADCRLAYIGHKTFLNVPKLRNLKLRNNNLTTMKTTTFEHVEQTLLSLELYGNPWNCNCNLKPFIEWVVDRNLYTSPTSCQEPAALRGRSWLELTAEDLACRPQISVPDPVVDASGGNATLRCRSSGSPFPEMHWVFNSRIIGDDSRRHLLREGVADSTRWLNLTVVGVGPRDAGDYLCVAKSPGGVEERTVLLKVPDGDAAGGGVVVEGGYGAGTLALIIGLAVGVAAFLIVAALVLYCCCRGRRRSKDDAARPAVNGDVQHPGGEEKFPLTAVNPVQKPPRRIERSMDPNGLADCTDVECNLLDNGSSYKPSSMTDSDDRLEDRSMDSMDSFRGKSQDGLDAESLRSDGHRTYPPDLLTFPPRAGGGHASPAGSSASTAPDSSRLPPQSPAAAAQLPPHLLFGTLPYSRSQSPFSAAVQPRHHQGYVTIPRRPRVPSWGSAHDGLGLRLEPVYDNLGPRTTADGSSVLSLNKTGGSSDPTTTTTTTPVRGRPLPPTPASMTPSSHCPPIREHRVASPGPWSRSSPEGASLRKRPPQDHSTPVAGGKRGSVGGSREKIPPRPPPKPKKVVEAPSGPLFEDEGEDGTEV